MPLNRLQALAGAACAAALLTVATVAAQPAAVPEIERPANLAMWPTVGSTVRVNRADGQTPWQLRQVQIEPSAFAHLLETRAYPDGAVLAARFYGVSLDDEHTPPLYRSGAEAALVMEVIDRSHADGRRFYVFANGAQRAVALPPGNDCAVCHNASGTLDGTFAHLYPEIAHLAADRE